MSSGLLYDDLQHLHANQSKKALIAVLSKPPSTSDNDKPRMKKPPKILASILQHFEQSFNEQFACVIPSKLTMHAKRSLHVLHTL